MAELGAPVLTVECDIRDADSIAAMFDAAVERFGLPRRAREQRGRELPGAGRGHVAERVAHRRRHHAHRHVPLQPRVRPPPPRRRARRRRSSTSARRTRGPAAPGSRTPRPPRPGVKNLVETLAVEWGPYGIQVNGLVPGLFPHADMTADIQSNLVRTHDKDPCQPALRVGQVQELGLGGHVPRVAVRALRLRPHPRGRRRQLAAALAHQPRGRDRARPDGPPRVHHRVAHDGDASRLRGRPRARSPGRVRVGHDDARRPDGTGPTRAVPDGGEPPLRADGTIQSSLVNAGVHAAPGDRRRRPRVRHLRPDQAPQPPGPTADHARPSAPAGSGRRSRARAEIIGPDDPHPAVDAERLRLLLREVFTAAGGTPRRLGRLRRRDGWRSAAPPSSSTPTRVYSN